MSAPKRDGRGGAQPGAGRPLVGETAARSRTVRVDDATWEAIGRLADLRSETRSATIRAALAAFVAAST